MLHLDKYFPRTSLGFFPSPIHKLKRMSEKLGVEIWAKRDDVSSGLALANTLSVNAYYQAFENPNTIKLLGKEAIGH